MDSFQMRHGTVFTTNRNALGLVFVIDGAEHKAVALKEVCYLNGIKSRNPCKDFDLDSKLKFSAVLDPQSEMRDIWKVIAAWSTYKPVDCFDLQDWEDKVSDLYLQRQYCVKGLWRKLEDFHSEWSATSSTEKSSSSVNKNQSIDWFLSRHGTIRVTNRNAIGMTFLIDGAESKAIAVKEVCYLDENSSRNPNRDFELGSILQFSAILDPCSDFPNIWKVVAAWTTYKPEACFETQEWESKVSDIYLQKKHCFKNILDVLGYYADSDCSAVTSNSIADPKFKNLKLEKLAIQHLNRELKIELAENNVYLTTDKDLDELLSNAENHVKKYVNAMYDSLTDFFIYHSNAFRISATCRIYPYRGGCKVESYFCDELPIKIKDYNMNQMRTSMQSPVSSSQDVGLRNMNIERTAVRYFSNLLTSLQQSEQTVFKRSSKELNELLEDAPANIYDYISSRYKSVGQFFDFHCSVFHVSKTNTIYTRSDNKIENYLEEELPWLIQNPKDLNHNSNKTNSNSFEATTTSPNKARAKEILSFDGPDTRIVQENLFCETENDSYVSGEPVLIPVSSVSFTSFANAMKPKAEINRCSPVPKDFITFSDEDDLDHNRVANSITTTIESSGHIGAQGSFARQSNFGFDSSTLLPAMSRSSNDASTQTMSTGPILSMLSYDDWLSLK